MFLSKIQSMFTHYIVIKSFSESISLLFSLYSFFIFYFWPSLCDLQWHPTPVFLPGKSHGRRSLVGCSPWGRWELDTTQWLHFHFSLSCIGEGNGNPLHCSLPLDVGYLFLVGFNILLSMVVQQWVVILEFLQQIRTCPSP